jgi:hypothetical protein
MTGYGDCSSGWTNAGSASACDVCNRLCYRSFKSAIGQLRSVDERQPPGKRSLARLIGLRARLRAHTFPF